MLLLLLCIDEVDFSSLLIRPSSHFQRLAALAQQTSLDVVWRVHPLLHILVHILAQMPIELNSSIALAISGKGLSAFCQIFSQHLVHNLNSFVIN